MLGRLWRWLTAGAQGNVRGVTASFDTPAGYEWLAWRLDMITESLAEISQQLTVIDQRELKILTAQQDFNADISGLQSFFADLATQLTSIQAELANQGVTNVSALDSLVQQAQALQPTVDALGAGTTPPAPPA